ncbi:MAG: PKD domain-containing protein [Bacteroidetes bacterium]|nr:PKD domain-containing protein [Bacteroidota bacterium]
MIKSVTKQIAFILLTVVAEILNAQCLLKEVSLADRANASDLIIEGKVISKESYWNARHSMIYTMNTLEVYKIFKGSLSTTSINIITEGGIVGFDRITVEPGLELNVGDIGVFTSVSNTLPVPAYQNNIFPHYNTYASVQGFIKYDQISGRAGDGFKSYDNIDKQVYKVIESQTQQAFKIIQSFSLDIYFNNSAKLMAGPSITNFSPATITAGTKSQLTINGTGFGATRGSGTVGFKNGNDGGGTYINPIATQYISWSDTQIIVEVPSNAGTGTITVNQSGTGTSGSTLTISYSELNATYDPGTGTQKYKTHHVSDNGSGGYTWQMHTAFDGNASAKASFIRAFDTWRCNTGVNWTIGSTTSVSAHSSDGTNVIAFDDNDALGAGVLGTCYSYWSSCDGSDWYVNELDIIFDNGSNITPRTWQYGTALPSTNEYDFETVAVHELGHGHQLGHVINAGAIMHYAISNGTSNRSLSTNDLNGGNDVQSRSTAGNACGTAMTNYPGCGTPPVANFTSNKTSVCAGGSVSFTDQSTNTPTSWAWTFSGGTPGTSTLQNPSITYNAAGTYTVSLMATNSNGSDTKTVTNYITVNINPSASSSTTDISCNGGSDGSASVSASSGASPYTYSWSTGSTAITIASLAAATYTCTTTDNKGCSVTTTAVVSQPSALSVSLTPTNTGTCGGSDGSITSSVSGGTPGYTYSWQNSATSANISSLVAATYSLTVTDNKGCVKSGSATVNNTGCVVGITNLSAGYCGITISNFNQLIYCDQVTGASDYEYRFVNVGLAFSKSVQRGSGLTDFNVAAIAGLSYATVYNVDVRAYVSGSWGSYGTVCTVTTPSFPTTQLSGSSCGAVFSSLNQVIYCDQVSGASDYEYRFVNSGTAYSQTVQRGSGLNDINLLSVQGLKYGLSYNVDVRAYVGGEWGSFGNVCAISISSVPLTQLASTYCGTTFTTLNQVIYCNQVSGGSNYEYRFVNSGTGYSQTVQRQSGLTDLNLLVVPGLKYGLTYNVDVRTYVGGTWGSFGTVCTITMSSILSTKVASSYCGSSVSSFAQALYCDQVPGASNYEYRVTNSGLAYSQTKQRSSGLTDFYMGWFSGLLPGTTYDVEVRAYVGGTWGNFGAICTVTTAGGYQIVAHQRNPDSFENSVINRNPSSDMLIYPNPISINNMLSIDLGDMLDDESSGEIKVYNILGGEITAKKIVNVRLVELNIDERFTPGLYFVEVAAGEKRQSKVIVIQ